MTIGELNLLAKDIRDKAEAAQLACASVVAITTDIINATEFNKPMGIALEQLVGSADKIAESFLPNYLAALTAAEVALDGLGSDILSSNVNLPK